MSLGERPSPGFGLVTSVAFISSRLIPPPDPLCLSTDCPMVPVSWTEVVCPETYVKERRKVAKLVAEPAAAEPESAQPKK